MICPKCGVTNPDYFVYCKNCSEKLPSGEPTPAQRAERRIDAYSRGEVPENAGEPFYDPRQRHNAPDPWELLDQDSTSAAGRRTYRNDDFLEPEKKYRSRGERPAVEPTPIETHKPRSHRQEPLRPVVKHRVPIEAEQKEAQGHVEAVHEPESTRQPFGEERTYETVVVPVPAAPVKPAEEEYIPQPQPVHIEEHAEPAAEQVETDTDKVYGVTRRFARPEKPEEEDVRQIEEDLFDDERKKPKKEKKDKKRKQKEVIFDDDVDDEDDGEDGGKKSGMIFWIVIALLTIALLVISLKIVSDKYGSIGNAFSSWFGGAPAVEATPEPGTSLENASVIVEATEHEGLAAHSIIVYGNDGDKVVFYDPATGEELKSAVITNGGYKLTIVDLNWIPEEAGDTTQINVKPLVSMFDASGAETKLDVPEFTVAVPSTTLELTSSDAANPIDVTSADKAITITGNTQAGTPTRLFWNDQEITASIDQATGIFIADVPLAEGVTEYQLKATLSRHSDALLTIKLNVTQAEVELDITQPASMVSEDSYTVTGKAQAGAEVTVAGTGAGQVTADADGKFSFTADLTSGYGIFEYSVTAASGSASTTKKVEVVHAPDVDAYSRKAQVFEYKKVLNNPNDSKGKVYRIDGEVASVETVSNNLQMVVMNVDGDSSKPVTLYYFSDSQLTVGKSYRIFADANGNTEETETVKKMPKMNCWYMVRN